MIQCSLVDVDGIPLKRTVMWIKKWKEYFIFILTKRKQVKSSHTYGTIKPVISLDLLIEVYWTVLESI